MSKAWRDQGRLHIECETCSSVGTTHAATTKEGEVETLPICPWCGAALGVPVTTLQDETEKPTPGHAPQATGG